MITMICMIALLALVSIVGSRLVFRPAPPTVSVLAPRLHDLHDLQGEIVDLDKLLTPYDVHRRSWLLHHGIPESLHARTDAGLAAMQLLGEVHELFETRIGPVDINGDALTADVIGRRWETIKLGLQFHDFGTALLDDLERHLHLVETGLDVWGSLLLSDESHNAGAADRLASDIARRSPVLVSQISAQLTPPDGSHAA
jgi:hypothetical protein